MLETGKSFLVDSHCHLDFSELSKNLPHIIENAAKNRILYLQTISTRISEFKKILDIAESNNNIFCSVGNHPLNLDNEGVVDSQKIIELCTHEKVTAIGETGLDYHYSADNKVMQQKSFVEHIRAAQHTGLPLIVHTRNADDDTVEILTDMYNKKKFNGVIHCFTASEKLAQSCLDIGFYISASGIVTFKNAKNIAGTFKNIIPLDKILIETDSPYLAPVPMRGKGNEPAFMEYTAKFMANLLHVEYDNFCLQTTKNYFALFKKSCNYVYR